MTRGLEMCSHDVYNWGSAHPWVYFTLSRQNTALTRVRSLHLA